MPIEMLKAQAIVARTYAAYHRQLNAGKPYHIVASTAHQQYVGRVPPTRRRGRRCARRRARCCSGQGDALPRLLPHGQRRPHRGSARRLRAPPTCRRSSRCASSFPRSRRITRGSLDVPLAELRRAPAEGRHLGRARRGPRGARAQRARSGSPSIAVRGTRGHGDAAGQRPPAAGRLRHAQEHALRGRRRRRRRALRRPRLRPRRGARPVERQDHGRPGLRRPPDPRSTTTRAPRSPRCRDVVRRAASRDRRDHLLGRLRRASTCAWAWSSTPRSFPEARRPAPSSSGSTSARSASSARAPRSPSATRRARSDRTPRGRASSTSRRSRSGPSSPRCSCSAPTTRRAR